MAAAASDRMPEIPAEEPSRMIIYGPQFPDMRELWAAQDAPLQAHQAGCSDLDYDRLVLERQQTEAAYLDGYDRDLMRQIEPEAEL
jgi:hypothetical protein